MTAPHEKPLLCTRCHEPITNGYLVGDGDGSMRDGGQFAHPDCYEREPLVVEAMKALAEPSPEGV